MFFFEKKNQKTFMSWYALVTSPRQRRKSFLLLFFKKEGLSSPRPGSWIAEARSAFAPILLFTAACIASPLHSQQAFRSYSITSRSGVAVQEGGLRKLINVLFPQTMAWSDPVDLPRLDQGQANGLAEELTKESDDKTRMYRTIYPLDQRIFSPAWNTCEPGFGCLRHLGKDSQAELIVYTGSAPDAEGEWYAVWSKQSQNRWRRLAFPGLLERIHLRMKPDVVVYHGDMHDGGTYLAVIKSDGGWVPNRYSALAFVPLGLDLRAFEPIREPDIVRRTPPCLMETPIFADAAASNCEPLDSLADYAGLPWTDPAAPPGDHVTFVKRIKILGRARGPDQSDWRLVRLGILHTDARDVTKSPLPHHIMHGSAKSPGEAKTATHLDYAVGWINLRIDPSIRKGWSFSGRP